MPNVTLRGKQPASLSNPCAVAGLYSLGFQPRDRIGRGDFYPIPLAR
jgi:hypothetical protein